MRLIASATCVLFDFDGPLARLFHGLPAPVVADVLKKRLTEWNGLKETLKHCKNPVQVVREHAQHDRVCELENLLAEQELVATASAQPTSYADELVRLLARQGRKVAIATNNSGSAVANYLRIPGLAEPLGPHVHGRLADTTLMKPHPYILERALESTGASAADCLMIGDSPDDFLAAEQAGVSFLGFLKDYEDERVKGQKRVKGDKEAQLRDAGARYVVGSLQPLYRAALAA
ncbi:HAD-IA family hydrolase [Streptomyces sp. NBC_01537]|uniref:HAD family hydrolase n=1 Tax=Streptomyces sp. NBC_01537 TaxID=2903896 RepID=UPI00386EE3FD